MGVGGVGEVVAGKWRQLYLNNNKKRKKKHLKIKKKEMIQIKCMEKIKMLKKNQ